LCSQLTMDFEKIDKVADRGIKAYEGVKLQLQIILTLALKVGN
jgi:hypothetical protein